MPSTTQPADTADGIPDPFPESTANRGENPSRYLVADLRIDAGDGTSGELILARIRGLETIALCRYWLCIERWLAREHERNPRDRVVDALEEREETLRKRGEGVATSGTTPAERRARGEQLREEQPDRVESCAVLLDEDGEERPWSSQQGARVLA